jgi:hypothetical protein
VCGVCARQRRAAAAGSRATHPRSRRRSSSALGSSSGQFAAHHDRDPGAARQPVQHVGGRLLGPQCGAGPTGHDPRRNAWTRRWLGGADTKPTATTPGRVVDASQAVSPRGGRILGGSARRCSFTPRSPAGQASQRSRNLTVTRGPTTAAQRPSTVSSRSRSLVAPRSIGQVPYRGLHPVNQDENAERRPSRSRARPTPTQHRCGGADGQGRSPSRRSSPTSHLRPTPSSARIRFTDQPCSTCRARR